MESGSSKGVEANVCSKVKWTRVPDLIERRKVFLKGGWAYVPGRELASIVFQEFEVQLNKALNVRILVNPHFVCSDGHQITAKSLPRLDEDTRLVPILNNLSQGFLAGVASDWNGMSSESTGDGIKAEAIDDMSKNHFPLCMRVMHSNLMKDHHLKHFGRLNYGLFLKVRACLMYFAPPVHDLTRAGSWSHH